jgi:hypothetical protein
MKKVKVILSIDEDKLREIAKENNYDYDLLGAVEKELGWVIESGIEVDSVEEIKEIRNEKIHIFGEDVDDWLLNLPRISSDGREIILEKCFKIQQEYPHLDVLVQESDDELGIIIDTYEDDDNIHSETFWYDDIN